MNMWTLPWIVSNFFHSEMSFKGLSFHHSNHILAITRRKINRATKVNIVCKLATGLYLIVWEMRKREWVISQIKAAVVYLQILLRIHLKALKKPTMNIMEGSLYRGQSLKWLLSVQKSKTLSTIRNDFIHHQKKNKFKKRQSLTIIICQTVVVMSKT